MKTNNKFEHKFKSASNVEEIVFFIKIYQFLGLILINIQTNNSFSKIKV